MVDHLWEQLLNSNEVQQLFERIGDAAELRAAMAAQGASLVEDVGRGARNLTRRLDDVLQRGRSDAPCLVPDRRDQPRTWGSSPGDSRFCSTRRSSTSASWCSQGLVAFLATTLLGDGGGASPGVLRHWGRGLGRRRSSLPGVVLGARGPDAGDAISPGIRLESGGERRIGVRRAIRRLFGLVVAVIPLGLGLLGVATAVDRRGWQGPHRAYRRAVHNQLILISSTSASCTTRCAHQPGVGAAARWSCWVDRPRACVGVRRLARVRCC